MGLGVGIGMGGRLFYVCLSAKEEDCDKIRPFFWPFLRQNVQRVF